jgi:GH35 family endo-1,4-beta-xylanase
MHNQLENAANPPNQPSNNHGQVPGEELIGPAGLRAFDLINKGGKVDLSYLKVEGQPFTEAIRVDIQQIARSEWDIQLRTRTASPVGQGDVLLATIYFRTEQSCEEGGLGRAGFVFELASDPWTKYMQYTVRASYEWKKITIPFIVGHTLAAGEAQMTLRLGFALQIIEIGGLSVENFQKKLAFADLPNTKLTYPGMAPDAPWRKAAEERIDKIRKGPLRVVVKGKTGQPVPNATVNAKLVKHAFAFGTCVPSAILISGGNEKFKRIIPELFNIATLENDLKWAPLSGDWGPEFTLDRAKQGVKWLHDRGLLVRGHTLVWPSWRYLPKFLHQYKNDPTQLRIEVQRHLRELTVAMKESLVHWDVVNEPVDNHDILDILGPEVMIEWFKEVRATSPSSKLFINDYGILSGGGGTTPHRDHYEETIKMLVDKGAPLDGIGMQSHFDGLLTGPDDMLAILDRYAKYGIPIWATEYDIDIDDEEVSGKFTRDFYTALFSHPSVEGIMMWGFWDGLHWKNNAPMYRQDWSLKPSGEAIRELLLKTWSTDARGTTDALGTFTTCGFLGEYVIQVSAAGKTKSINAQLKAIGSDVEVTID